MEELWDDGDSPIMVHSVIDPGRSIGCGRGFVPCVNNGKPGGLSGVVGAGDDDWKDNDIPDFSGSKMKNDFDNGGSFDGGDADFLGGRGGGRGRGGRGGRGGGRGGRGGGRGGRGGGRGGRDDEDDNDSSNHRGGDKENGDGPTKPREVYIPPDPTDDEETMFAGGISSGINFDKYDNIQVRVTGDNVPSPVDTFQSAGLRSFVLDNVKKSGYMKPTPVQKHALPIIMNGRDLMACAQTGSGKTAAFLLPMINVLLSDPRDLIVTGEHSEPHAIIISPTRELTLQIFNEARKFSHGSIVKTVVAYGGTAVYHQAQQVMRGCHILVATPGRLMDFVNRGRITFSSVRFVVLDEADRMLDMGFMPEVEKMMAHPTMVPMGERQTLMFSATFPEDIQRLAGKFLHDYLFLAVGIVGSACADVEQRFHMVSKFDKRPKLTELLTQEGRDKTLVFVEMKRTADFIAAYLSEQDFPTTSIHGDRLQREREEALCDFKTGNMGVLVATAVAARGLDIKNVAHVVNYDLPKSIDEYVHRIGRTGRVGNRGKATSFYDPDVDSILAKDLVKILKQANQEIPSWLEKDASSSGSSYGSSRPGHFGGRDFRKFDNEESTGGSNVQPQPLEPEEDW